MAGIIKAFEGLVEAGGVARKKASCGTGNLPSGGDVGAKRALGLKTISRDTFPGP